MINNLIEYFTNKKIIILGFGREGQSSYNLIRRYLKNQIIYVADKNENFENNFEYLKNDENVVCISGDSYINNLEDYDIIMKAPGISFAKLDTSNYRNKIKSQLELFLEFFENFTIGITGTKGKSTTSSLIYKVIKEQNRKCVLLGNIGVPVFDFIDTIEDDMIVVLEMSSHQLEYMKHSPNVSILLNVYQEHLDHYESFEKYAEAKCNIYKNQNENDYFLYNIDNEMLNKIVSSKINKTFKVSIKGDKTANIYLKEDNIYFNGKAIYNKNEPRNLVGDYNLNNIMFVLGVSEILNLDINQTINSIADFKTLSHRLELVGKINEVSYYDNSIGTVPMATIEAINALGNVDTVIIGGMDRGLDYSEFIKYLNDCSVSNIVCMPKTGHDIAKQLKKEKAIVVNSLEEAVEISKKVTKKNCSCLLSPAAASYGFFKNFEEKGDLFKKLILEK